MIYSYFGCSAYLSTVWLEAVCSLLLKTQPCVKPEVREEEMSRPRDSGLSWHFEVYFVQSGLSAADAVSANAVLGLSAPAGHCQLWSRHRWQQREELCELGTASAELCTADNLLWTCCFCSRCCDVSSIALSKITAAITILLC